MSIEIVFETHALSEDNERGIATGWLPGRLSERGGANAAEMGRCASATLGRAMVRPRPRLAVIAWTTATFRIRVAKAIGRRFGARRGSSPICRPGGLGDASC